MCSIKIILNDYNDAYYPGQTITGRAECIFSTTTTFRGIRIQFLGQARNEWDEFEYNGDTKQTTREIYKGVDDYFRISFYLVPEAEEPTGVEPGTYNYPFSFTLPPNIPSSYEAPFGKVLYSLKVIVNRENLKNYSQICVVNIVAPLNLNEFSDLREPVALCIDENLPKCCCTNPGMVNFQMSLPATGFVAGLEINVGCYVRNLSTVNVECVEFTITEEVEFFSFLPSTKTKRASYPIVKQKESGIGAHGEKSWTSTLIIPMNMYHNLKECRIIDLHYCLRVEVVMPHPHKGLMHVVPIMIGTVGLTGINTRFSGSPPPGSPPTLAGGSPFVFNVAGNSYPSVSYVSEIEAEGT